ncbi:hypothetical protein AO368_0229 [Moraxella catarrhalis]|nr:hypothetical protein AO368_0229 [Moraxella catarrhalis]
MDAQSQTPYHAVCVAQPVWVWRSLAAQITTGLIPLDGIRSGAVSADRLKYWTFDLYYQLWCVGTLDTA